MSFMMRPKDSLILAFTKLRVRRIRLAVTLIVMSLLFAGLVFLSIIVSGVVHSSQTFGKEGLGGRYIVSAMPIAYQPYDNPELNAALEQPQKDLVAQKTALAKKYNLLYDAKTDPTLPLVEQQMGPRADDTKPTANPASPIAAAAMQRLNERLPIQFDDFTNIAKRGKATHVYRSTTTNYNAVSSMSIQVLKDGKEDYGSKNQNGRASGPPTGLESITSLGWNAMSDELLQPFLLKGQTTAIGADGSIPVTAPFSAGEQLLGLRALPATATTQEKLERLTAVRQGVAGKTTAICYRNQSSSELLQKAISQTAEINANEKKAGYILPSLQYALPEQPCGPVVVKKDSRTAEEKRAESRQNELDAISNPATAPVQGLFAIRIVGLTADISTSGTSLEIGSLLSSILVSNLGHGWLSPISIFQPGSLPALAQGGAITERPADQQQYFAEFGSLAEARQFIKRYNCNPPQNGPPSYDNYVNVCKAAGTLFSVNPYGNNAGAIDDFKKGVWKIARYVLLAIVIIATVVLMGTLGKIIADSRRETAVFRALGARRLHISQIYLLYALLTGLLIIAVSFVLGVIGAAIVGHHFEPRLSVAAVLAYNSQDVNQQFSLFGLDWLYLAAISLIILGTALLAAIIPLITNMRRNPIRDMRDE